MKKSLKNRLFGNLRQLFVKPERASIATNSPVRHLESAAEVTCVLTSFNQIRLLEASVASVLNQTLPFKEILVCDDASTDGSREYIAALEAKLTNVRGIYRSSNLGPGLNRHMGILEASNPFVTQVDGDDRLHPTKLEKEWKSLGESTEHVVFSNIMLIDRHEKKMELNTSFYGESWGKRKKLRSMLFRDHPIPRDMLFSKDLYERSGGYESRVPMYEDWSLKLRLLNLATAWRHSGALGTYYNRSDTGLSRRPDSHHSYWKLYCISRNYNWLKDELEPNDILHALLLALSLEQDRKNVRRELQEELSLLSHADMLDYLAGLTSAIVGMKKDMSDVSSANQEITARIMGAARTARQ